MVDFAKHTARIIGRLGSPVTITPSGQPSRIVNAVFSSQPADAFGAISGSHITIRAMASDCSGLSVGDPITRNGAAYSVARIDSDAADSGDVLITLESA